MISVLYESGYLRLSDNISIIQPSLSNQNLLFKVENNSALQFVKVYPASSKSEYESEHRFLQVFRNGGISVPAIVNFGTLNVHGEDNYILVTDNLAGAPLEEVLPLLSDADIRKVANSLLDVFKRQMAIHTEKALPNTLTSAFDKTEAKFEKLGLVDTVNKLIEKCRLQSETIEDCTDYYYVTHDWRMRHIFIANGIFSGLLDLEYVRPNDFAVEIGHFLHDLRLNEIPNSKTLALEIITGLTMLYAPCDSDYDRRVKLYMTKQALAHIAGKLAKGEPLASFDKELKLARSYCKSYDLIGIFQ